MGSLHKTKKANKHHTKRIWTRGKSFCSKVLGFCTLGNVAVEDELNTDEPSEDGGGWPAMRAFKKSIFGSSLAGRDWVILGFPTAAPILSARMNSVCWPCDQTDGSTGGADEFRCDRSGTFGSGISGGSSPIKVDTEGLSTTGCSE